MAFSKKAKPAEAVDEPVVDEEEPAPTAVETTLEEASAGGDADSDMMASLASNEPEEKAEDGGGDKSLLDMFTSVGIEVVDRSTLTNLAGEVDMADLVSELNIVAAALGIVMSERAHHEELLEEDHIAA